MRNSLSMGWKNTTTPPKLKIPDIENSKLFEFDNDAVLNILISYVVHHELGVSMGNKIGHFIFLGITYRCKPNGFFTTDQAKDEEIEIPKEWGDQQFSAEEVRRIRNRLEFFLLILIYPHLFFY